MPKKAIKLEFEDDNGARYSFKVEGDIEKSKVLRLLELYDLLSSSSFDNSNEDGLKDNSEKDLYTKIKSLVKDMPLNGFTSKDVQNALEDRFKTSVKLPIISTYLRRMYDKGELSRKKVGREWVYFHKEIEKIILKDKRAKN